MASLAKWMDKGARTQRNQRCGGHTALSLVGKRCAVAAGLVNSEAYTLVALSCNIDTAALVTANDRYLMATCGPSESTVVTGESVVARRTERDRVGE